MNLTTFLLLLLSLLFDVALAATKTTRRTSTPTGVSRTTVTKYKKTKSKKVVPWSQLSKGAKIAIYVVCGLAGLVLIGFLGLVLLRKRQNRSSVGQRDQEEPSSGVTSPSEKPFNHDNHNNDGGETWAIPPPSPPQNDDMTHLVPTQPMSYAAPPPAPVGASLPHSWTK